jgi:GT2 family glycosyltransferase
VRLVIDATVFCPPNGVVLKGWILAVPGAVREVRLCSGDAAVPVDLSAAIRTPKWELAKTIGRENGFDDPMSGFVAFVPEGFSPSEPSYLAVETRRGEIGFAKIPPPRLQGLAAIREILACHLHYSVVGPAFDRVLGPSVARLNAEHVAVPPAVATLQLGASPQAPAYSVIVPLYRRLEYMELQFALFGREAAGECELIYVLDDPPRRGELERLAVSIYERFRIPFTIAFVERNMGFAPACNIGLGLARGRYVCFLNSDVFPHTPDWLARLAARLAARSDLGVVGALLLFDDGSVQHRGMTWQRHPEFGNWYFNEHPGIGRRPPPQEGLLEYPAITGACMVLRTETARAIRGFDESYVVGDFEDSDLCLRLRQRGLASAVDLDVRLYHLTRQSQPAADGPWRHNLTLYNAWLHHHRWEAAIGAALEAPSSQPAVADVPVMVA